MAFTQTTTTDPTIALQTSASTGNQTGTVNNQQGVQAQQTGNTSGNQNQSNVYTPAQQGLQGQAIGAAGNYLSTGAPPPGVTGADQALVNAYTSQYNQQVAPQIAAAQGPGSAQIGSQLALGLEQLDAGVYGTNLSAYENAMAQAGTLGFTPTGTTANNAQGTTGTSSQTSTSDTQQQQDWQQALADLQAISGSNTTIQTGTPF